MSKVVKSVASIFGGVPDFEKAKDTAAKYDTRIDREMTPEQKAEQRAALAAQGRRPNEEEAGRQQTGVRPLQGSGTKSSYWV